MALNFRQPGSENIKNKILTFNFYFFKNNSP